MANTDLATNVNNLFFSISCHVLWDPVSMGMCFWNYF